MQLLSSPTSPYARKVRITILEKGLSEAVAILPGMPLGTEADAAPVRAANPLGKIPALLLADGTSLYDSPVICEYLDTVGTGARLLPADGPARWSALRRQALGDGVADAAFATVMEFRRPEVERSVEWQDRWLGGILRAADAVEADLATAGIGFDLGAIGLVAAFSYVSFRLPNIDWKAGHPLLTAWMATMDTRPSVAATAPPTA